MNIWVGPSGKFTDAKPVTRENKRGIRQYSFAFNSQHVLYAQDAGGDENWHIHSVDLATGKTLDLTPMEKIAARIEGVSEKFPEEIVLGINDRDPRYHDLYRVNIRTGERSLLQKNDGFQHFVLDDDFKVRFAQRPNADGSLDELRAVNKDGAIAFEPFEHIEFDDVGAYEHVGFDKTGNIRYYKDTRGRETAALLSRDLTTGNIEVILKHDQTDVGEVLTHPTEKTIQAVEINYEKPRWTLINRDLERDLQFIRKNGGDGEMLVPSRTQDDRLWIVVLAPDNGPSRTYLYDRGSGASADGAMPAAPKLTLMFVNRPGLQDQALASMTPVMIKSRDGLNLVSYLTLPVGSDADKDGRPEKPLPMVLLVHGGPWARDAWGFNASHQWLANRGYAVLSVNFRGSTGFGKQFLAAGKQEWAAKMHDDLLDAVKWAQDGQIADPAKIAIMGGSYGGYATLVGLTFTPEIFACGVDIVGPSNLSTLLKTMPAYWKPMLDRMHKMVGDNTTDEGRAFLMERSPISKVDRIKRPLLIGQGANDPRVKQDESDQIVKAMTEKKIPVTYVLYPDEGHGFQRPENRTSFNAVVEAFLAQHLGGRVEPIGEALKGSSITVPAGADQIPGLSEALSAGR